MEEHKKYIVDFHTHILPGMDDGAGDPAESLSMLYSLASQAVDQVFLTPHFILHREDVPAFLRRREAAAEKLAAAMRRAEKNVRFPRLRLGAEVRLEQELLDEPDVKKLCYAGTDALLLEFPFRPLERRDFETLENMVYKFKIIPVIAHLERYLEMFDRRDIDRITALPNVIVQCNTGAFRTFGGRRFVLSLMREGIRVVLGSDAHNMGERPPEIAEAYRVLERKLDGRVKEAFYRTVNYFTNL